MFHEFVGLIHIYKIRVISLPCLNNDDSPGVFFIFSEILIFQAVREVKGQKIGQNEK